MTISLIHLKLPNWLLKWFSVLEHLDLLFRFIIQSLNLYTNKSCALIFKRMPCNFQDEKECMEEILKVRSCKYQNG